METDDFVSLIAAEGRHRLGHRTHSVGCRELSPVTGEQWLPESLIRVKVWPSGDVQASVATRKIRPPKIANSGKRTSGELSEEDALRSARRARRGIWDACQSLGVNCMLTIGKRGGFDSLDEAWAASEAVLDMMKERGWIVGHVTVPELHTGERSDVRGMGLNIGKWHVHVGTLCPSRFDFHLLHEQMKLVEGRLLGHIPQSPAERMINVDVQLRRGRFGKKRCTPASIARYLGDYLGKSITEQEQARDINRKRYDVSRGGTKPRVFNIRCNPGEIVHPNEAVARILHHLAPGRTFSSPWRTEVGGQVVVIQSALDWGVGAAPPCLDIGDLTARDLWHLIETKVDGSRKTSGSETSAEPRRVGHQMTSRQAGWHRLAKPGSGGGRPELARSGQPAPPPATSLVEHLNELWHEVDSGPPPWQD